MPIVEPEILIDGTHDITTTARIQERVLTTVYAKLQVRTRPIPHPTPPPNPSPNPSPNARPLSTHPRPRHSTPNTPSRTTPPLPCARRTTASFSRARSSSRR